MSRSAESQYHRITIVTVCLNQVDTIERAMNSVLGQEGVDVEYIVIDGGSTDGTKDIIERYQDRLACWVSEPDRGQSHALNKGFARASGEIIGWLNADDELLPKALEKVAREFRRPDIDVLCGACEYVHPDGFRRVQGVSQNELDMLMVYDPIHQPSCFWKRELFERVEGLKEELHWGMDWDLWLQFKREKARFKTTDNALSVYHITGYNKTATGGERRNYEMYRILRHYNKNGMRYLTEFGYRIGWPLKRFRRSRPVWFCRTVSNTLRTVLLMALGPLFGFGRVRRCTHPFS